MEKQSSNEEDQIMRVIDWNLPNQVTADPEAVRYPFEFEEEGGK